MFSVLLVHLIFFLFVRVTAVISTLSLHDALPIFGDEPLGAIRPGELRQLGRDVPRLAHEELTARVEEAVLVPACGRHLLAQDRKSTRLNSSHSQFTYAVLCLKKIIVICKKEYLLA